MAPLPPLQELGFGTSRWRLQGNATSGLRAGEGGHHLFSCRTRSAPGTFPTSSDVPWLVASLIGRLGSSAFRLATVAVSISLTGSRFSSESAPRPFHHGIRRRGGTTNGRPCRQINGRPKRPSELTSSIVPRGTSFHRRVELNCPPIGLSCRCRGLFPGPTEFSAVNPVSLKKSLTIATTKAIPPDIVSEEFARFSLK